jgi:acid phosphatase
MAGRTVECRSLDVKRNFLTLKTHVALVAAVLALASAPLCCLGQQSRGQQTAGQQPAAPQLQHAYSANASAERIPNLDTLKHQLEQYHDCTCTCGCYAHDIDMQADRGIAFLRRRVAQKGPHDRLAMVLDIDETSLSNYQEMLKAGFAYDSKVFDAWVQSAQAPANAGVLRLYKTARQLGVSVFFVTGRPQAERDATERNLRTKGFDQWQELTLFPASARSESVTAYKSGARARIAAEGYKIVLNVGDQWSDLRSNPEAEFSVKIPNPYYVIP